MQDSQSPAPEPASRRRFFFGAATVGAAAAAATVLPVGTPPAELSQAPDVARPAPEKGGGYSLSEHVKRYYKTTQA
ncbi:MAG: formate dehydrogenase [Gammaproteobacteria bacterium]|nr:formate dehydrogenase [Gammaproteobacteria bacterium]MBU1443117.1 formate dehydrogenase [Gammaproteobacteria bacterium]